MMNKKIWMITLLLSAWVWPSRVYSLPPRGVAGDKWADRILGKLDFSEITPNEATPRSVFNPTAVFVDRNSNPQRLYVFDSSNSRVLGFSDKIGRAHV